MKPHNQWIAKTMALACGLALAITAVADTTIATFDDYFFLNQRYGSWASATIFPETTGYSVTAVGWGSGYKDINPNIDATGETNIELTVTITADTGPASPASGPIVSLVDADGTFVNFAWYGQTIGTHVLTAKLDSPTWVANAGTVPGLDLATLDFFHLQDDPGAYTGQYTIKFERLRLTGKPAPEVKITSPSYNPATGEFTLTWSSSPGKSYTLLHSLTVSDTFSPLVTDLAASDGNTTTTTVTMPTGDTGFLRVEQQP